MTSSHETPVLSAHPKSIRTVRFSYGTCNDAELDIPVGPCSIMDICSAMRQSYLRHMFSHRALMSDEVLVSSIGRSNYFAGALGGYESRLSPEMFALVKDEATNNFTLAVAVVRYRANAQGRTMSSAEVFAEASTNKALSPEESRMLRELSELPDLSN